MSRQYFGTDGIRGRTNAGVMTAAVAMKVGQAAGRHFLRGDHRHRVVIGKDTRLSGYMLESAMVAGFTSVGMDVVLLGPMPTPAVALLTRELRADVGVMISASHNPYEDNGIKLFGPDGFKLFGDEVAGAPARMKRVLAYFASRPGERPLPQLGPAEVAALTGATPLDVGAAPSLGGLFMRAIDEAVHDHEIELVGTTYELAHFLGALANGAALVGHGSPDTDWRALYRRHGKRALGKLIPGATDLGRPPKTPQQYRTPSKRRGTRA